MSGGRRLGFSEHLSHNAHTFAMFPMPTHPTDGIGACQLSGARWVCSILRRYRVSLQNSTEALGGALWTCTMTSEPKLGTHASLSSTGILTLGLH